MSEPITSMTTEAPPAQEAVEAKAEADRARAEGDSLAALKAEARKWEAQAKANKSAADELAQIRESQKTEAEKAAERLAEAEKRATEAEARAQRRDIALEFKLSREDAGLLDTLTDEAAMRTLAERLAAVESDKKKNGNVSPREGTTPSSVATDPKRAWLRASVRGD